MATNEVYSHADTISLPVASGTVSGDPVAVGDLPGVALTDRDASGNATVKCSGAYDLSVKGNNGTADAAIGVGDTVYFGTAGDPLDTDSSGTRFGYALAAVASGVTATIPVKIGY